MGVYRVGAPKTQILVLNREGLFSRGGAICCERDGIQNMTWGKIEGNGKCYEFLISIN